MQNQQKLLAGRVALVTGGGRGIGRGVALALARQGAAVGLMARTAAELEQVAAEIGAAGGKALAVTGDVASYSDVERVVAAVAAELGPIDVLINNAAVVGPIDAAERLDPAAWAEAQQINLVGAFNCQRAVLAGMLERGWGRIVNISSGAASGSGLSRGIAYSVSKAGLDMLARATAAEVGERGVQVCSIYPGVVDTAMQTAIRETPEEQAGATLAQRFRGYYEQGMLADADEVGDLLAAAAIGGFNGEIVDVRRDHERLLAVLGR